MRSLARLALVAALLAGSSVLAATGPVAAQEDAGEEVTFSSTCQQLRCFFEVNEAPEDVGNVSEVRWSFGPDQANETGNPVRHTFPEPGTFEVSVLVEGEEDEQGNLTTATGEGQVTVREGEVPWSALGFGAAAFVGSIVLARAT